MWRIPFKGVILAGSARAFRRVRVRLVPVHRPRTSPNCRARQSLTRGSAAGVVDFVQIYASGPQMSAYLIDSLEGKFYYGETLLPSLVYPIPVLGKPYRDTAAP